MTGPFDDTAAADAADRERGRNDTETVSHGQLKAFVERIERMAEERQEINEDIKEIYAEAKGNGYNTKVLRKLIARRKQDRDARLEEDALLEIYEGVFG